MSLSCLGARGRPGEPSSINHSTAREEPRKSRPTTNNQQPTTSSQQSWRPARRPGPQRALLESLNRSSAGTWTRPSGGSESCTGPGTARSRTRVGHLAARVPPGCQGRVRPAAGRRVGAPEVRRYAVSARTGAVGPCGGDELHRRSLVSGH